MAAEAGIDFYIAKAGTRLAGLRQTSLKINRPDTDITSGDDNGFQTFMAGGQTGSFEMTAEGVWKDDVIQDIMLSATKVLLSDITMVFADGATLACDVSVESYEMTGSHEGELTYSTAFKSSGAWVWTPAV